MMRFDRGLAGTDVALPFDGELRRVALLGATGSIGESTLKVLRAHPERLRLVAVAADRNAQKLAEICREFHVPQAVLSDEPSAANAQASALFPNTTQLHGGLEALADLAPLAKADIVLVATTGTTSLKPALRAIEAGIDIALANKEMLVLGGAHVVEAARRSGVKLLPTDSEHNALFQCLRDEPISSVSRMILTASGGQFRDWPIERLGHATPDEATRHPNWSMGKKITVDSATMANKGLELIEAHWLFGLPSEQLEVVIHPQSVVHSMVEFCDHSTLAQLSPPCMTFAIQNCLLYPERHSGTTAPLDFSRLFEFSFFPPDPRRYPCLGLAREALSKLGSAPAAFNAANEVAVERFLEEAISFTDIARIIESTMKQITPQSTPSLEELLAVDAEARTLAREFTVPTTITA